jgi:regulator of RNase E activity RraA
MVADHDGAVVITRSMVEDVAEAGRQVEILEEWILEKVYDGRKSPGLYPPNEETLSWFQNRTIAKS